MLYLQILFTSFFEENKINNHVIKTKQYESDMDMAT